MRLNKFIANANGCSRREADKLITAGRVSVNSQPARLGQVLHGDESVSLDGQLLSMNEHLYLMLHKPVGYVCSRHGQGAPTIYELLPERYRTLKCVGRLDKDTSGLIVLSNDGDFAQLLTHPSFNQVKTYAVELNSALSDVAAKQLLSGVELEDGPSKFDSVTNQGKKLIEVSLHGGRNRQIRRTFAALGYEVRKLHRTEFGPYALNELKSGEFKEVSRG